MKRDNEIPMIWWDDIRRDIRSLSNDVSRLLEKNIRLEEKIRRLENENIWQTISPDDIIFIDKWGRYSVLDIDREVRQVRLQEETEDTKTLIVEAKWYDFDDIPNFRRIGRPYYE